MDFYVEESDEAVVLDQIISDLEYAETIANSMENIDENTSKFMSDLTLFKGRANKYSIQTLMADVYLWKEDYQKCIDYCNKVIDSKLFSLENETDWFKIYAPGNSKESIFEVQYSEANKETNPIYDKLLPINSRSRASFNNWVWEELFLISDIRFGHDDYGPVSKYILLDIEGSDGLERDFSQKDANFIYYKSRIYVLSIEFMNPVVTTVITEKTNSLIYYSTRFRCRSYSRVFLVATSTQTANTRTSPLMTYWAKDGTFRKLTSWTRFL